MNRLLMQILKIGEIKRLSRLPRLKKSIHKFDGEHYWKIGKSRYPLSRIIKDISKAGFKMEKTYRVFEYPYHRLFVLSVRKLSKIHMSFELEIFD